VHRFLLRQFAPIPEGMIVIQNLASLCRGDHEDLINLARRAQALVSSFGQHVCSHAGDTVPQGLYELVNERFTQLLTEEEERSLLANTNVRGFTPVLNKKTGRADITMVLDEAFPHSAECLPPFTNVEKTKLFQRLQHIPVLTFPYANEKKANKKIDPDKKADKKAGPAKDEQQRTGGKHCEYHNSRTHNTTECHALRDKTGPLRPHPRCAREPRRRRPGFPSRKPRRP
jgi:hypothetical protein